MLVRVTAVESSLQNATFEEARLEDCDLTGLKAAGSRWIGASLSRCRLSKANLNYADFSRARLESVDGGGAELSGAVFHRTEENDSRWEKLQLKKAEKTDSDLAKAEEFTLPGMPEIME